MTPMDKRALQASDIAYANEDYGIAWLGFANHGIPYSASAGFSATLTPLPAPLSASAILSFAGTDPGSWANWRANSGQAIFGSSSQYDQAVRLSVRVDDVLGGI